MKARQARDTYTQMLSDFSPKVQELAIRARALILDVAPEAFETVWTRQKTAGYGTGPKKMSEHFCWIAPQRSHVNLGFNYGSELPDPEHLLEGSGKLMRHVKIRSEEDLNNPALRRLIEKASKHRVPPLPKSTVIDHEK